MNSSWDIAPVRWDLQQENKLSQSYLELLMRWLAFADLTFEAWDVRPNCGHFFGGCHGIGSDTSYTSAIYAVLSRMDAYDEQKTGLSRSYLQDRAIKGIRYLGFTHGTGPADCVRTQNGNSLNKGRKWGRADE